MVMAKWTGQENCKEVPIIPAFTGEYAQFFFLMYLSLVFMMSFFAHWKFYCTLNFMSAFDVKPYNIIIFYIFGNSLLVSLLIF